MTTLSGDDEPGLFDEPTYVTVAVEGAVVQVEVQQTDPQTEVSALDMLPFDGLASAIQGITKSIVSALKAAAPQRASVELGLDVGLEQGVLTAILVKGKGQATIKITLEWVGDPAAGGG